MKLIPGMPKITPEQQALAEKEMRNFDFQTKFLYLLENVKFKEKMSNKIENFFEKSIDKIRQRKYNNFRTNVQLIIIFWNGG